MTMTSPPHAQQALDDACRLLDDVSRSPHSTSLIAVHCLSAVEHLQTAGAARPVDAPTPVADPADVIRHALNWLASLPADLFATSAVLEAFHHAQTALAATRFGS